MRESGATNQTIMHCIFVGPAGVGKSSLMKRLLHMKLDLKRTSTQVAEKSVRVEIIRDVSTTTAQVFGLDWQKIEDPISQASGLIGHLSTTQEKCKENPSTLASGQYGRMSPKQEKAMKETRSLVFEQTEHISKAEVSKHTTSQSLGSEPLNYSHSQYNKAIDFFRQVLKEKGVSGLHQHINPWTLYLTDLGGQPEFQELLPALVVGPCIFFVVFPLDKDLKGKYEVEYVRPNEQKCMQKYLSSLTLQEDLLRSLASIASTKYKDKDGIDVIPRVILVATFKDKVPQEEDRQRRLKELQDLVKETDTFRQGMIVDASETQMVFTINNASEEESEKDAKEIRYAFHKLSDCFKVHTPSSWLIFSILVQHLYAEDSIISKKECFEVAWECGIHDALEFEAALEFLHKQTGVLHYYTEPTELSQIVIKDPQHLFNRVNQLVERTFVFERTCSIQRTEDFKRGIFKRTDYEMLTKDYNCCKLNPSMLLKLLEHLNVVVPLCQGKKYFMPCAIAHLEETAFDHTQSSTIPPLLITFRSGYCPKGIFGALVACIVNKQVAMCTLNLDESRIHRDQICFRLGLYKLLFRINPTYIYIKVVPKSTSSFTEICTLCNHIRRFIEHNIMEACKTLRYSENANYGLSFVCQCDLHVDKEKLCPAEVRNDPVDGYFFMCTQSKDEAQINPYSHVWLPGVSNSCATSSLITGGICFSTTKCWSIK